MVSWLNPARLYPYKGRTPALFVVTVVTAVYLLLEFSFNSRLLDAVGGVSASTSIEGIERWGRSLSGFAGALLIWPWVLGRTRASLPSRLVVLIVLTAAIMTAVYQGERDLLDGLVDRSTPAERYAASNLMLLQHALLAGDARIDGLDLGGDRLHEPDGKAFLATFPFMLLTVQDIDDKIAGQRAALVRRMVDRAYGGLDTNFNRYVQGLQRMRDGYRSYVEASRRYDAALDGIAARQDSAWVRYESDLRRHGLTPYSVPARYVERVRAHVRASGVPVTLDWRPSDRDAFYVAVARQVRETAQADFHAGIVRRLGADMPPNLGPAAFIGSAPIQHKLAAALCYPRGIAMPVVYRTPAAFDRAVYGKVLDTVAQQRLDELTAPIGEYADGRPDATAGKANMRALLAPPLALAFSVSGAVVHVFKVLFFLIQCLSGRGWVNAKVKSGVILLGTVGAFAGFSNGLHSPITDQDLFRHYIFPDVKAIKPAYPVVGEVVAHAIRGTIHFQPYAYPMFEWIRLEVFRGMDFGYQTISPVASGQAKPEGCGSTL